MPNLQFFYRLYDRRQDAIPGETNESTTRRLAQTKCSRHESRTLFRNNKTKSFWEFCMLHNFNQFFGLPLTSKEGLPFGSGQTIKAACKANILLQDVD